jgi:prepilin-type processing-associated H-X9-DG protein
MNNLKHVGLALLNYHEAYDSFPAGEVIAATGQSFPGWQASIVPFVDSSPWYDMIDFRHTWDDPRNIPAFRFRMGFLLIPGVDETTDRNGFALSHYASNRQVLGQNRSLGIADLPLGSSHTVLAGEIAEDFQPWGQSGNGRDPEASMNSGPDSFGRYTGDGANLLMADGSVRFVANQGNTAPRNRSRRPTRISGRNPEYFRAERMLRSGLRALVQIDSDGNDVAVWVPWAYIGDEMTVTDDDLKLFIPMTNLDALFIRSGAGFSDTGLEHLAGLKKLQVLEIHNSSITDRGLRHLEALTKLKVFQLSATEVTDDGVSRLKAVLPNCDVRLSP